MPSDTWRVVVTGPVTGIDDWLAAAAEAGWEALRLPLLEVRSTGADLIAAGDPAPDWIAITSANALPALAAAVAAHPPLREARLAVVGEATAERAREAGLEVALVPAPGASDASGLARAIAAEASAGQRVLWPRGDRARGLDEALAAAGLVVRAPIAYETVPAALPPELPEHDAVFFASPSAVEVWAAAAPHPRPAAIAIGWTTYDAVLAHDELFSVTLPLSEPNPAALRLALESFFPST